MATIGFLAICLPDLLLRRVPLPPFLRGMRVVFAALAVLGLASCWYNGLLDPSSISGAALKYGALALVIPIVYRASATEQRVHRLWSALLIGTALAALYSIYQYQSGSAYQANFGYSRVAGTFGEFNILGGFMVLMLFPTLFTALNLKGRKQAALLVIFVLELGAMFLSLTLGSILGFVVALALGTFLLSRWRSSAAIVIIFITLVSAAVLWQLIPAVGEKVNAFDSRAQDRTNTYKAGLVLIREHPLLGLGSDNEVLINMDKLYQTVPGVPKVSVLPHNAVLAISAAKGVGGGLLLLALAVLALRLLTRYRSAAYGHYRLWHLGILLGTIALLQQNITNLLLLDPRVETIWLSLLVIDVRLLQLSTAHRPPAQGTDSFSNSTARPYDSRSMFAGS
jgi:O-antigen ligase